jgi:predicted nucleic acid-binding protein
VPVPSSKGDLRPGDPAARSHADLTVKARAAGKGFLTPDGYIAAIAAARGFAVASCDTAAFDAAGLTVIDPWR